MLVHEVLARNLRDRRAEQSVFTPEITMPKVNLSGMTIEAASQPHRGGNDGRYVAATLNRVQRTF
jgi:hypothetical protein